MKNYSVTSILYNDACLILGIPSNESFLTNKLDEDTANFYRKKVIQKALIEILSGPIFNN